MMTPYRQSYDPARRKFLRQSGAGFSGLALTSILAGDGFFNKQAGGAETSFQKSRIADPFAVNHPRLMPRAKHVIFLFMYGGPPSMDTWDYKPELQKRDGQKIRR